MKKKLLSVVGVIVLVGIIFSIGNLIKKSDKDGPELNIYFLNSDSSALVAEKQKSDFDESDDIIETLVKKIIKGPSNAKNVELVSRDTKLNSVTREKHRVTIDFSRDFLTENKTKNALAVYGIVKTLSQLPEITEVKVLVEGSDILGPDGNNIGFLSGEDINIEKDQNDTETRYITLYFADENGKLERERRKIKITDTQPIEQYILNELIKGPNEENLLAVLSSETSLISVQTIDETCFVNFTSGFVSKNTGNDTKEKFAIYSIVNSLTELEMVKNVQFLVEGKKITEFGNTIMSENFFRREDLIKY